MSEVHTILQKKILEIGEFLHSKNITAGLIPESLREYSAQAELRNKDGDKIGSFTLYYSPKRNKFNIRPLKQLSGELSELLIKFLAEKPSEQIDKQRLQTTLNEDKTQSIFRAYVDGSYLGGKAGFGAVIVDGDNIVFEIYGSVSNPEYLEARQVAGELYAVGKILQWCKANSINKIEVYYDYAGIEAWATGVWKTKQTLTRNYAKFVRDSKITVRWRKVVAHTGDKWNEYADDLAKRGASEKRNL